MSWALILEGGLGGRSFHQKKEKRSYLKAEAFSFDYGIYVIALTSLLIQDLEAVNSRKYV